MDLDELAVIANDNKNRRYLSARSAETPIGQSKRWQYVGKDATTGRGLVRSGDSVMFGEVVTNGYIVPGTTVEVSQAGGRVEIDSQKWVRPNPVVLPKYAPKKSPYLKIKVAYIEAAQNWRVGAYRSPPDTAKPIAQAEQLVSFHNLGGTSWVAVWLRTIFPNVQVQTIYSDGRSVPTLVLPYGDNGYTIAGDWPGGVILRQVTEGQPFDMPFFPDVGSIGNQSYTGVREDTINYYSILDGVVIGSTSGIYSTVPSNTNNLRLRAEGNVVVAPGISRSYSYIETNPGFSPSDPQGQENWAPVYTGGTLETVVSSVDAALIVRRQIRRFLPDVLTYEIANADGDRSIPTPHQSLFEFPVSLVGDFAHQVRQSNVVSTGEYSDFYTETSITVRTFDLLGGTYSDESFRIETLPLVSGSQPETATIDDRAIGKYHP